MAFGPRGLWRGMRSHPLKWLFILGLLMLNLGGSIPALRASVPSPHPPPLTLAKALSSPARPLVDQSKETDFYRPVAPWVGRLILPPATAEDSSDWVWIEIKQAPSTLQTLIGKRVKLEWQPNPQRQADRQGVTRDVNFSAAARHSQTLGNIHPQRLDGRQQVGPLQSLAGARPVDDLLVALKNVEVEGLATAAPKLRISEEPVQIAGPWYALVQIQDPVNTDQLIPSACPGSPPCPSQLIQVRHYHPQSHQFDGPLELVNIPQVPATPTGIFASTPRQLAASTAGRAGWYIYGDQNQEGLFVVSAIAPRALFQLEPDQVLRNQQAGLHYFKRQTWEKMTAKKGRLERVSLETRRPHSPKPDWQERDKALVIHLFGGIGGAQAEGQAVIGTVTGHFAYGLATVVRDPFTEELQFEIDYQQIYAHNPEGIIAGASHWSEYMGNLHRGWLGSRPVLDLLVKLDLLTQPYQFGQTTLSPWSELQQQLQLMAARYRIGDGTGAALVTPAKSCVQDASQAVYTTIKRLQYQVQTTPTIQTWLQSHPQDPQSQRFKRLISLGNSLEKELVPLGVVRADWQQNVARVTGIQSNQGNADPDNLFTQLLSWRTLIPRVAHEQITKIFLR
ncbi:MAG: CPBP family intramembrane metalloprotease domain-containing protein, partial [Acaryochloridaceae cyanobacterium SU_2_1]|nr:CPBP family intramembrane metalloprotease domain-containing protein [Acaryochloridaceae cyanobacterium SU_2_1]